jgi:hypothetical protein
MAIRKPAAAKKTPEVAKAPAAAAPTAAKPVSTPVRNTPIPKVAAAAAPAAKKVVTHDQIAKRAYEIWASGKGGSEADNWHRAEQELRSGL